MPKMIVNAAVVIHRSDKKGEPQQRFHIKPARKGEPAKVFDFTEDEVRSINGAHPGALTPEKAATQEVKAPPAGGNDGGTGDKHNDAPQNTSTGANQAGTTDPLSHADGGAGDDDL